MTMENRGSKEETLYYMIEGWHGELADTDLYFHAAYRQEHPVQKGHAYTVMYAILGNDSQEMYNGQQRFLLYRFHVKDPVYFHTSFRMTMDNLGWTGARYDDYTSVAYWYMEKPSRLSAGLPSDEEIIMK